MEITFECPHCRRVNRSEVGDPEPWLTCRAGDWERAAGPEAIVDGGLRRCLVCATDDLYVQKDFPHGLGLAIVVVGFVVSTVFWYFYMPLACMAVLLATAALDLVLYQVVRDVTICYRCLSQYRGDGANPEGRFRPFDLAVGERYRQERLRIAELREREVSAGAPPSVEVEGGSPSRPSSGPGLD